MANDLVDPTDPQTGSLEWLKAYAPKLFATPLDSPNPLIQPGASPVVGRGVDNGFWEQLATRQPGWTYGSILPVATDPQGNSHLDFTAGLTGLPIQALGGFERILAGKVPLDVADPQTGKVSVNPEITHTAGVTAGLVSQGSLLPGMAPAGSLGMFAGLRARGAPLDTVVQAEKMLDSGMHPNDVWQLTGWHRGPEGDFRFEIPDTNSKLRVGGTSPLQPLPIKAGQQYNEIGLTGPARMGDLLDHPELFKAYPDLADILVNPETTPGYRGSYNPVTNQMAMAPGLEGQVHSTSLHELQHAIQDKEGFAPGGNTRQFITQKDIQAMQDAANAFPVLSKNFDRVFPGESLGGIASRYTTAKQYQKELAVGGISPAETRYMQDYINKFRPTAQKLRDFGIDKLIDNWYNSQNVRDSIADRTFDQYQRLAGETEARNVQERMHLDPDYLQANGPLVTQEFPDMQLLLRAPGYGAPGQINPLTGRVR